MNRVQIFRSVVRAVREKKREIENLVHKEAMFPNIAIDKEWSFGEILHSLAEDYIITKLNCKELDTNWDLTQPIEILEAQITEDYLQYVNSYLDNFPIENRFIRVEQVLAFTEPNTVVETPKTLVSDVRIFLNQAEYFGEVNFSDKQKIYLDGKFLPYFENNKLVLKPYMKEAKAVLV